VVAVLAGTPEPETRMARTYSLLQYDIPERRGEARVRNPSGTLRRLAVRTSYSVWVVPQDRVPWGLLDGWTHAGVRWHLVPFAAEAAEQILALATETLRSQIAAIQASADKSLREAGAKLERDEAAHGPASTEAAHSLYQRRARRICRRAERLLADAEAAARCFGMPAGELPLGTARAAIRGLQVAAQQRAALYAAMVHQVAGTRLDAAANASDVPAEVLADFIEENGLGDMTGVREAFAPPAPTLALVGTAPSGASSSEEGEGQAA
jgi:hypothetical protein